MNGIIPLIKPVGLSSADAVFKVRRALSGACGQKQKCGHMGTLDPGASGVLPIGVGKATRLFDVMLAKRKRYVCKLSFGINTDTLDAYGRVTAKSDVRPHIDDVKSAIALFVGHTTQTPPNYSAVSVNGRRAYKLARTGEIFELAPKEIDIYSLSLVDAETDALGRCEQVTLAIDCGGGTYIRTLCADVCAALRVCGYMSALIRTASGNYDINDAVTLEEFYEAPCQKIIPIRLALEPIMPIYKIDEALDFKFGNGVAVTNEEFSARVSYGGEETFAVEADGDILGIVKSDGQNVKLAVYLKD